MGREGVLAFLRWWTEFIRFQTLPKLLYMRRRGKGETEDVLSKPGMSLQHLLTLKYLSLTNQIFVLITSSLFFPSLTPTLHHC